MSQVKIVAASGFGYKFGVVKVKRGCVTRYYGGLLANSKLPYHGHKSCFFPTPELAELNALRLATHSTIK